jgi:kinetochore protein Spc7/SPC105
MEILRGPTKEPSAFKAKVMVLFPTVKAKAFVSFVFTMNTISYWPMSIDSLQHDVEVAYGAIE